MCVVNQHESRPIIRADDELDPLAETYDFIHPVWKHVGPSPLRIRSCWIVTNTLPP